LYDIKHSPNIAVCLLITEDHLDWHKDVDQYRDAKENIFKFANKNCHG
jgi:UDP-N-acetylmuramoylalanine-D-glutamate ligase